MNEVVEFCRHVKAKCTRAKPLEGAFFHGKQIVVCPTWEEKEKLEGKGVFPLHADELEGMVSSLMNKEEKTFISDLMLRFSGIRFLGMN